MPRLIRLLDIAHAHGASARLHAQARSRGPSSGNADGGTKNKLEELHFRSKVVCVVSRESSQIELLLNLSASFNNNNIFPATALRRGRTSYLPQTTVKAPARLHEGLFFPCITCRGRVLPLPVLFTPIQRGNHA